MIWTSLGRMTTTGQPTRRGPKLAPPGEPTTARLVQAGATAQPQPQPPPPQCDDDGLQAAARAERAGRTLRGLDEQFEQLTTEYSDGSIGRAPFVPAPGGRFLALSVLALTPSAPCFRSELDDHDARARNKGSLGAYGKVMDQFLASEHGPGGPSRPCGGASKRAAAAHKDGEEEGEEEEEEEDGDEEEEEEEEEEDEDPEAQAAREAVLVTRRWLRLPDQARSRGNAGTDTLAPLRAPSLSAAWHAASALTPVQVRRTVRRLTTGRQQPARRARRRRWSS